MKKILANILAVLIIFGAFSVISFAQVSLNLNGTSAEANGNMKSSLIKLKEFNSAAAKPMVIGQEIFRLKDQLSL